MTETYRPTADEVGAFNDDLRRVAREAAAEGDRITARDLRTLAEIHWPGENVRVKSDSLGIDWLESNPDLGADQPEQATPVTPTAEVQQATPSTERAPQRGPQSSAQLRAEALQRTVEAGHPVTVAYGMQGQGAKLVTAGADYDGTSRVFDAHGRPSGGVVDGLDEQAGAELAALPAYGQPGSEKNKRRA